MMSSIDLISNKNLINGDRPRKKLGVIGGMGPAASAYLYELLTNMTRAETDQDHLEIYIISRPSIPDRTAYILGKSTESPVAPIIEAANMLKALGVDYIAIPCATTHCFYDELTKSIKTPLIHMVRETAAHLAACGTTAAGVMATDGAVSSGLFQKELGASGIRAIIPSKRMQSVVMDLVYNCVKAGKPFSLDNFISVADELRENGAEKVILACTELSMIKRETGLSPGYLDVLEVLARRCLELCGLPVRKPEV